MTSDYESPPDYVNNAIAFAIDKHKNQLDKSGFPYILHIWDVYISLLNSAASWHVAIAGLLHDIIEDTDATVEDLINLGLPQECIDIIIACTHIDNEPWEQYVDRIIACGLDAIVVKLADIDSNTRSFRNSLLEPHVKERLSKKYDKYYSILVQAFVDAFS